MQIAKRKENAEMITQWFAYTYSLHPRSQMYTVVKYKGVNKVDFQGFFCFVIL